MFTTLLVVCSMDGANICHFPEGALFPFLSGIDYVPPLSSRFVVFVENHHVKLSSNSPPSRPARSPARGGERGGQAREPRLPTLPAGLHVSACVCRLLPNTNLAPVVVRVVSPGASVRRVSHTSHPPLSPPLPLSTRLMVVEGHIRIPGDGRKKC